jgi:nucleoside-diphosphate-sugar epimerase
MRVLVTGASGFVGSHAVPALVGAGHDVRVFVRQPEKAVSVLLALGVDAGSFDIAVGDMTDAASAAAAINGCDAVIHAAADIGVAGATGPADDTNVRGVHNVVGQAVDAGIDPIVYTSSVAVYLPSATPVITVDSPMADPMSTYGQGKRDAEVLIREWQAAGAPITTLVLGSVYGPRSPHLDSSFAALRGALEAFMAVTDGGMGIVDVRDLAEVLVAALEPGRGPRRYVIGGRFVTWEEWAATLSVAIGREVPIQRMTVDEMIEMGRQLDKLRETAAVDIPLSEEAAVIMTAGVPTDDGPAIADLGASWRPTVETFRDAVAWLVAEGHVAPEPALPAPPRKESDATRSA